MNKLLALALITVLSGCSALRQNPDVVEVPDDLWQKAKKRAAEQSKADEEKRKTVKNQELEKLNKALEQIKSQETGRKE